MKKTVKLTNLIKAKNDLELYIKIDQMKKLKKLFDPTFDIKDLNSKIENKEDQLILIKEAINEGNLNKDEEGHTINYSIYQLSKLNRFKSDSTTLRNRLENSEFLDNDRIKDSLLKDVRELDDLINKETDKKKKSDLLSSKSKLKRSLSKVSLTSKSHMTTLKEEIIKDLQEVEEKISNLKAKLTVLNNKFSVDVDVLDGFDITIQ